MTATAGAATDFALGSVGAGLGATTVDLKGGLGSASAQTRDGITVGALAAVNAAGCAVIGGGPHFWAAPYERDAEFGGHGLPASVPPMRSPSAAKGQPGENTTLVVVATDAALTKPQARRLAIMAQDGMARALASGPHAARRRHRVRRRNRRASACRPGRRLAELGALAADVVARAIARGVYEARALPFPGALPAGATASALVEQTQRSDPYARRQQARRPPMPSASAISMAKSLQL